MGFGFARLVATIEAQTRGFDAAASDIAKIEKSVGGLADGQLRAAAAADEHSRAIGGQVAVGELLAHGLEKTLDLLMELPGMLVEVGTAGGRIIDVEHAFDGLAGGAGQARDILAALNQGTKDTVPNFELLKDANKLLADGARMTTADFGTMAAGARLLAKSSGLEGGTAEAMEILSQAMATGRVRALNLIGVHVNLDEALAHYSITVGKSVGDFTAQDKVAAMAAETLNKLRDRLAGAGEMGLSFGEKVQQAHTHLANFQESIDEAIARDPVLAAGMDAVGKAFKDALGANEEEAVKRVVAVVEQLTVSAVVGASYIVDGAASIVKAYESARGTFDRFLAASQQSQIDSLQKTVDAYQKAVDAGGTAMRGRLSELKIQLEGLKGYQQGFKDDAAAAAQSGAAAEAARAKLQTYLSDMKSSMETAMAATKAGTKALEEHGGAVGDTGEAFVKANKEITKFIESAHKIGTEFQTLEATIGTAGALAALGTKLHEAGLKALELHVNIAALGPAFGDAIEQANKAEFAKVIAVQAAKLHEGLGTLLADLDKLAVAAGGEASTAFPKLADGWITSERRMTEATMYGTALRLAQIKDAEEKELESFAADRSKMTTTEQDMYDKRLAATHAFYQHQQDVATGTADTLEERMRSAGIKSQADLNEQLRTTQRDYGQMQASGEYAAAAMQASWQRMVDAAIAANGGLSLSTGDLFKLITQQAEAALAQGGMKGLAAFGMKTAKEFVSTLASAIPVIGPALAAVTGPLMDMVGGLFTKVFGTAGRDAVKTFADSFGGFDALHLKLTDLGAAGEQMWIKLTQQTGRNDLTGAQATIAAITQALKTNATAVAADAKALDTQLGPALTSLKDLGGNLPAAFQPYIDKLKEANLLTQGNLDLIAQMGGDNTVSFAKMKEAAGRYNLSLDAMGKSYQQATDTAGWQQIIDDLDVLGRGGADMNAVLKGMSKNISGLVDDSIAFGTTIPENMKPWIQKLADTGQLLDANGTKITDTSKLTFGESLQTSVDKLVLAIKDLIDKLTKDVPAAIRGIPTSITTTVDFHGTRSGDWPNDGTNPNPGGASPDPTSAGAGASILRFPSAGGSASVLDRRAAAALGGRGASVASSSGGGGGGNLTLHVQVNANDVIGDDSMKRLGQKVGDEIMRQLRNKQRLNAA
jgi:hypothetical protein